MCFWMDNSAEPNKYQWKRVQGKTPSGRTGPNGDHTTEMLNKDGRRDHYFC